MSPSKDNPKQRLEKAKLVALIAMYFGENTADLYKSCYADMPIEFVEKSSEKLLMEYLGMERARALILEIQNDPV